MPTKTPKDNTETLILALREQLRTLQSSYDTLQTNYDLIRDEYVSLSRRQNDSDERAERFIEHVQSLRSTHRADQELNQRDAEQLRIEQVELETSMKKWIDDLKETVDALDSGIGALLNEGATTQKFSQDMASRTETMIANVRAAIGKDQKALMQALEERAGQLQKAITDGDEAQAQKLAKIATTRRMLLVVAMGLAPVMKDALVAIGEFVRSLLAG